MTFQASDKKGHHFLDLFNDNNKPLKLTYSKSEIQLKYFGHSNSIYIRAIRAIVNYTLIREYQLRFFPKEYFKCLYRKYPIEMRWHILFDCKRYNKYQNPRRDTIGYFTLFLEFNNNTFAFGESITWSLLCFAISFTFSYASSSFPLILHVVYILIYIVTKQLSWSVLVLHVINC